MSDQLRDAERRVVEAAILFQAHHDVTGGRDEREYTLSRGKLLIEVDALRSLRAAAQQKTDAGEDLEANPSSSGAPSGSIPGNEAPASASFGSIPPRSDSAEPNSGTVIYLPADFGQVKSWHKDEHGNLYVIRARDTVKDTGGVEGHAYPSGANPETCDARAGAAPIGKVAVAGIESSPVSLAPPLTEQRVREIAQAETCIYWSKRSLQPLEDRVAALEKRAEPLKSADFNNCFVPFDDSKTMYFGSDKEPYIIFEEAKSMTPEQWEKLREALKLPGEIKPVAGWQLPQHEGHWPDRRTPTIEKRLRALEIESAHRKADSAVDSVQARRIQHLEHKIQSQRAEINRLAKRLKETDAERYARYTRMLSDKEFPRFINEFPQGLGMNVDPQSLSEEVRKGNSDMETWRKRVGDEPAPPPAARDATEWSEECRKAAEQIARQARGAAENLARLDCQVGMASAEEQLQRQLTVLCAEIAKHAHLFTSGNCAYCKADVFPSELDWYAKATARKNHDAACPSHPMRALEAEVRDLHENLRRAEKARDEARSELAALREKLAILPRRADAYQREHHAQWSSGWDTALSMVERIHRGDPSVMDEPMMQGVVADVSPSPRASPDREALAKFLCETYHPGLWAGLKPGYVGHDYWCETADKVIAHLGANASAPSEEEIREALREAVAKERRRSGLCVDWPTAGARAVLAPFAAQRSSPGSEAQSVPARIGVSEAMRKTVTSLRAIRFGATFVDMEALDAAEAEIAALDAGTSVLIEAKDLERLRALEIDPAKSAAIHPSLYVKLEQERDAARAAFAETERERDANAVALTKATKEIDTLKAALAAKDTCIDELERDLASQLRDLGGRIAAAEKRALEFEQECDRLRASVSALRAAPAASVDVADMELALDETGWGYEEVDSKELTDALNKIIRAHTKQEPTREA